MPQMTLLDVVNSYKNATEGYQVNDLTEDYEAESVAKIAEEVYYEFSSDFQDHTYDNVLTTLDSVGDSTKPNYLAIPYNVHRIHDSVINYDKRVDNTKTNYQRVKYLDPHDFLDLVNGRNSEDSTIDVISDFSGVKLLIKNNKHPEYYTSIDDEYVIFDAYDSSLESTLQSSKSQVIAQTEQTFTIDKDFVIPLPSDLIPTYLSEVKARASEYLREEPLFSDARMGRIGKMASRFKQHKVGPRPNPKRINYGRRS